MLPLFLFWLLRYKKEKCLLEWRTKDKDIRRVLFQEE